MSEIPVTNLYLARKREKEKEKRTNICLRNSQEVANDCSKCIYVMHAKTIKLSVWSQQSIKSLLEMHDLMPFCLQTDKKITKYMRGKFVLSQTDNSIIAIKFSLYIEIYINSF